MNARVAYWNNIPAPYMVDRFNAVADRGTLDFEAWFSERRETGRSWDVDESAWRFRYRYLPRAAAGPGPPVPAPLLGRRPPDLLVSLYAGAPYLLGWEVARRREVRTAFWCEVTFDRWVRRRRWKETLKRYAFRRADGIITAGRDGRAYAGRYGAHPSRVFLAPHTIDAARFRRGRDAALPERDRLRSRLGLRGVTFVYVGRLWRGKGLDHLLDAFAALRRRAEGQVTLLLVGDGPEGARLLRRCRTEGIGDVVFAGFRQGDELPRLYTAADVFVFPTLGDPWGLVVEEAMACGLPVISTEAAGEIRDRIDHGADGFIVPPADAAALLAPMERLAGDPALRERVGRAAERRVADQSPDRWAADFERAVDAILAGRATGPP